MRIADLRRLHFSLTETGKLGHASGLSASIDFADVTADVTNEAKPPPNHGVFNANNARVNESCKYNAFNKHKNSNTKRK